MPTSEDIARSVEGMIIYHLPFKLLKKNRQNHHSDVIWMWWRTQSSAFWLLIHQPARATCLVNITSPNFSPLVRSIHQWFALTEDQQCWKRLHVTISYKFLPDCFQTWQTHLSCVPLLLLALRCNVLLALRCIYTVANLFIFRAISLYIHSLPCFDCLQIWQMYPSRSYTQTLTIN